MQCRRPWGRGAYSQVVHFASEVEEDGRPGILLQPLLQDVCGLVTPYRQQTGVSHMQTGWCGGRVRPTGILVGAIQSKEMADYGVVPQEEEPAGVSSGSTT